MVTRHGAGKSHGRAVGGAGAAVAEGHQGGEAARLASTPVDRRHTVPGPNRCSMAGYPGRIRTVEPGLRPIPPAAAGRHLAPDPRPKPPHPSTTGAPAFTPSPRARTATGPSPSNFPRTAPTPSVTSPPAATGSTTTPPTTRTAPTAASTPDARGLGHPRDQPMTTGPGLKASRRLRSRLSVSGRRAT